MRNWLLPENLEDILPPQAQRIDAMRGRLPRTVPRPRLRAGNPPLLEYMESLLTGTARPKTCAPSSWSTSSRAG